MIASVMTVFDGRSGRGSAGAAAISRTRHDMNCDSPGTIHTIGHSTRTIEVFRSLLQAHAVELLIDVRRWPASRRHPQFNREELANALEAAEIGYLWRGDLGGYRKPAANSVNTAWQVGAFRAYADFMLTPAFAAIVEQVEKLTRTTRAAFMCAEAVPWQCHRQLLADAFLARGWEVRHIMDGGCRPHKTPPFARVEGTSIIYSGLV
jgi:uncharacterized protein (DUF488 family)